MKLHNVQEPGDPICLAPFISAYTAPARMSPCCELVHDGYPTVEDLWNSDLMRSLRVAFRDGTDDIPDQCKTCLKSPSSHRDFFYLQDRAYFKETYEANKHLVEADGTFSVTPLVYLPISLETTCDLKCRICYAGVSSAKHKLAVESGTLDEDELLATNVDDKYRATNDVDYIALVKQHASTLREVVVHGGNPTQHEGLPRLIEVLKTELRDDCKVVFLTNGTFEKCKNGESVWDLLKGFNDLHVTFSMDAAPELNEYSRTGIKHARLVSQIFKAREELPDAYINIHASLSNITVLRWHEFLDYIAHGGFFEAGIRVSMNVVNGPARYHPGNLPGILKARVFRELQLRNYDDTMYPDDMRMLIDWAKQAMFDTKFDQQLWNEFIQKETAVDAVVGESILDILPELRTFARII